MIRLGILYKDSTIKSFNITSFKDAEDIVEKELETGVKKAYAQEIGKPETRKTLWEDE